MEVLGCIVETGQTLPCSRQADRLLEDMKKYDFVFYIHLMEHILNITHTLSQCLQRKEQDLMNAVKLVSSTKNQLEKFRLEGFNEFLEKVNSFCDMYELEVKNLDDEYINPRWPRRKTNISNRHYYEYDCFNAVLDLQIQEFGNRFNEVTSELLLCISCLSPCDNFSAFDIPNILKLAEKYPYDFDEAEKRRLPVQLGNYIDFVKKDKQFANLDGNDDGHGPDSLSFVLDDLKHIDLTDLEKMDILHQVALPGLRANNFYKRTGVENQVQTTVGESLVEEIAESSETKSNVKFGAGFRKYDQEQLANTFISSEMVEVIPTKTGEEIKITGPRGKKITLEKLQNSIQAEKQKYEFKPIWLDECDVLENFKPVDWSQATQDKDHSYY
ncbi:uncharacterized protein LOC110943844 [Helianthus annuus]|uniref:uncharacterized protein LOC110943844 n=1 Tax=Helianthus annuus TaxID=4232 RepID=UPI000B8EEB7B|nr:uncharacterized protein LOC110943844 [Helianthus annuus]